MTEKGKRMDFQRPRSAGVHYALIQALYWSAMAVYLGFGAAYLYGRGLNSLGTGLVLAAAGLCSALLQPLVAGRADRAQRPGTVRRYCLMLILPAACILLALWLMPMPAWMHIGLYALVWMLMLTVQFLLNSLAMEYPNSGHALNYGIGRAMGSLGYALAACLYGLYAAKADTAALLPLALLFCLLLCVALLLWRSPPLPVQTAELTEKSADFFRRYPRFLLLVIGTVLCLTPYCIVCNFLVRIIESVGGSSVQLGAAVMLCALCEIPLMLLSVWLCRRCGVFALMLMAAVMLSVKMLLFTLARSVGAVYVAEASQMFGYPLLMCVSVYYVNALMGPQDRVRGQAMMALTQNMGSTVGALLGGFLLDGLGVKGLLAVSLGVSVVGSAVMMLGTQRVKSPAETAVRSDP